MYSICKLSNVFYSNDYVVIVFNMPEKCKTIEKNVATEVARYKLFRNEFLSLQKQNEMWNTLA